MSNDLRITNDPRDRIIQELEAKVERLLELLEGKAKTKSAKKPLFTENYSLERNKTQKAKPCNV